MKDPEDYIKYTEHTTKDTKLHDDIGKKTTCQD
jgi:hypothetical protein